MGAAMPILMGIQTIGKLAGANADYHRTKEMLKAQQQAAEQNAKIEGIKASQVAENFAAKQKQADDQMRLVRGQIAAAAGASGLANTGSATDALTATEEAYLEDSKNILRNQRNATWGYMVNQANYLNESKNYDAMIAQAKRQRNMSYFNTLIGAASQAYDMGMFGKGGSKTSNNDDWYKQGFADMKNRYANNTPGYKPIATTSGFKTYF